jgi:RNA polymerase sigma-70 factor (ECF subfamily)
VVEPRNDAKIGTDTRDFAELLEAAQAGSRDAVGELIDGYRTYLLLIANQELDPAIRAKLGASDVVQETMLTAQQAIGDFRGSTHEEMLGWLRGILLNDLLEAGRSYRGTAMRNVGREIPIDGDSRLNQPPIEIRNNQDTPSVGAAETELETVLYAAMSRLSKEHQQVLRLRNWQQLPFADIGSEMNRTPDAARKLWSRAVLQLQRELGDVADD